MAGLAELITPKFQPMGFGPARLHGASKYVWIPWPSDLWFGDYTQNGHLHVFVYDDRIALRVHVDAFHGDRPRNNAALDLIRAAVEAELLARMPTHRSINWRDAKGGNNQVCAVDREGGVRRGDLDGDAKWVVAVTRAWLETLIVHPIPDLRQRVERRFAKD